MTPGPTPDHTFIEFVHARRGAVGGVFLALAVICLLLAGYCGYRGFRDAARPAPDLTQPAPAAETDPPELEPRPYQVGTAAALLGALALGGVGAFFVGQLPDPDPAVRRRRDRLLLLLAGYLFGLACRAVGLFLFVFWFGHLTDWVNGVAGSHKTGWQPIAALLLYLIGAGVTFLATIPARAEERHHPFLRRAVYAVNFALSAVLLVVGLVLANAVVAMKAPDALDTTATGFYTLTPQTTEYLRGLSQPVKVIAVVPVGDTREQRVVADALRLIAGMREVNPQRFETEQLSVVYDKAKLDALQQKYPSAGVWRVGLLVTTGGDSGRAEFLPYGQMLDQERRAFVGEAELYRTLRSLIDKRTTAYFTQGSREPLLDRPTDPAKAAAARTATRLKEVLEKSGCTAKPLDLDPLAADPKVPDDADLVVVLDPLAPLPPATVSAIQRYAAPAAPKAKRGKLVVFTPARAGASGGLLKTGLEEFLREYGIGVTDGAVYTRPTEKVGADWTNLIVPQQEVQRGSPIALAADGVDARNPRWVALASEGGQGTNGIARPVLFSGGGLNWLEQSVFNPAAKAWQDLDAAAKRGDQKYIDDRMVMNKPIPVGAVATDPTGKPAVAVFGVGEGLADDAPGGGQLDRLLAASVDWLSERPAAPDISPKEYVAYLPKRGVSEHLLFTVPVVGTLLFIVLLGLGVWAIRRK